ncbi:MAG: hypothetical protein IJI07_06505 [Flexilinea sp.]|nr:hypothetical protein [Flexilinea sp.]
MSTYRASYTFPAEFMWGIIPHDDILDDKEIYSYLFSLQENRINALRISIPWSKCEPLSRNFDEVYIESIRLLLSRLRERNIAPLVILNTEEVPGWKNLDHPEKGDFSDEYDFSVHLIDALIPYTGHFGMMCPKGTILSRNRLNAKLRILQEIFGHIHGLSGAAKAGLILTSVFSENSRPLDRLRYGFLRNIEADFLGIDTAPDSLKKLRTLFPDERKAVIFLSNAPDDVSSEEKTEMLADNLYEVWQFYQEGWPIRGYFSRIGIEPELSAFKLYTNACRKNAFEISTDMPYLPDKWQRFLKD